LGLIFVRCLYADRPIAGLAAFSDVDPNGPVRDRPLLCTVVTETGRSLLAGMEPVPQGLAMLAGHGFSDEHGLLKFW
jgi:hypothetical protein